MPFIELLQEFGEVISPDKKLKIMIFTEGTILMHKNLVNLLNFASYLPIGNCVCKIQSWEQQGAEINYFTSRRTKKQVGDIVSVLKKYNFPGTRLYYRGSRQKYNEVVEIVRPDILIEDDCKSIGGPAQMCITYVKPEIKNNIKSVVIAEFEGIDHLPELITELG